jgi:hypothetical protein
MQFPPDPRGTIGVIVRGFSEAGPHARRCTSTRSSRRTPGSSPPSNAEQTSSRPTLVSSPTLTDASTPPLQPAFSNALSSPNTQPEIRVGVHASAASRTRRLLPSRQQQPPRDRFLIPLLPRTISDSAAFARASATALASEGRAAVIALGSVVGVKLHIHRDVGVCSIGHDELAAVPLLRQQGGHAAQPVPGLWNHVE